MPCFVRPQSTRAREPAADADCHEPRATSHEPRATSHEPRATSHEPQATSLLLFDIDGTLLTTNGLGRRVVAGVLGQHFGRPVEAYGADFAGKTDPQIFRELLTREGSTDVDQEMMGLLARFERRMAEAIVTASVTPLAGALALVASLAERDDLLMGLLTGNLQPLAYAKIGRAGFEASHFVPGLGAFGSDHEDRDCLGPFALERASAMAGRPVTGGETIVVGDTPRDITCARAIGATAVAVASSRFDARALADADLVLESLEQAGPLLDLLA